MAEITSVFPGYIPSNIPSHIPEIVTHSQLTQLALKREYESQLGGLSEDEDLLIEVLLTDGRVVNATNFGYSTIEVLTVNGFIGADKVSVYMHHTLAQVLFRVKQKPREQPRRAIGFQVE